MGLNTYNKQIMTAVVLSTNRTSSIAQLKDMVGFAIQAVVTGTPTGTFKLQGSCDPVELGPPPLVPPTNWTDVANTSTAVTAAGSILWNLTDQMYNWVQIVYTDTSGGTSAAVVTATFNGKGV